MQNCVSGLRFGGGDIETDVEEISACLGLGLGLSFRKGVQVG